MVAREEVVLVTRFSALGDIAMTIPALYDVCRANPECRFVMLTRKGPARLFINAPANLRVVGVDLDDYKGPPGLWRLAGEMKALGVTKMVDLHDVLRTMLLRRFLAMRGVEVSHIHKGRGEKKELTRHRNRQILPLKPTIERYRDTFRRAGLKVLPEESTLRFLSIFPGKADPALFVKATPPPAPGEKWIGLAPFARHKGKIYPPSLMREAIAEMASKPGVRIFLFAGGPEEERQAEEWAAEFPQIVNLAPLHLGFEGEMALMNHCDVVVSMDSANMHLASLAGTRVVSIWGATHPYCGFLGFNQKNEDTIQLDMSCRPCSVFGDKPCRRGDYHCLCGISPSRIIKAVGLSLALLFILPMSLSATDPANAERYSHNAGSRLYPSLRPESRPYEDPAWNLNLLDEAYMALQTGDFQNALLIFYRIRPGRLPMAAKGDYWYGLASAAARLGLTERVELASEVLAKDPDTKGEAAFLKAYLAYVDKDFPRARKLLRQVPPRFLPSLYISQIDFQEGNWKEAARGAETSLETLREDLRPANSIFAAEAARMAGISRFKLNDFAAARPLLEEYIASANGYPSADAAYSLGQIEYESGNATRARELLAPLTAEEDWFGQAASYTLAQIDAASGSDREAALGFSRAARLNFDPSVGQNAIFNYIAAGMRGATVPFSSAAGMYEQYVERGHSTGHDAELALRFAREYAREGNYSKALETISRIAAPDRQALAERQKILYLAGRSEVESRRYAEAAGHLREAAGIDAGNPEIAAESRLWLGEALYSQGDYTAAAKAYAQALPGLKGANRTLALYDLGYALFSQDDFANASKRFAEALSAAPALPTAQKGDARLRLADCLFYTGRYREAMKEYTASLNEASGADYAAMRHAVILGLTGDVNGKIAALRSFDSSYPDSRWKADAALELGNTLEALDRHDEAVAVFAKVASGNPSSPQARRATLARAQTLAKAGHPVEAQAAYEELISKWPSSEEAALGADDLMRLCAREGNLAAYASFIQSVPGAPKIDSDRLEDLAFDAAEEAWADDITDTRRLREYMRQYPDGRYIPQALLDIARSEADAGNASAALEAFLELERKGGPDYAPEAYAGVMHFTDDPKQRAEYAGKVLRTGGVSPEIMEEANLYSALASLDDRTKGAEAVAMLKELAAHPERLSGARAAVGLGEWQLQKGNADEAVKTLTAFTDAGSPHSYWLAKGFIALSDAYRKQGNRTLADEYLRSLKENYPGNEPDILKAISSRLGNK